MSRFIELIEEYRGSKFHIDSVAEILERTVQSQETENAYVAMNFTYYMEKESPLSGNKGLINFDCGFGGMIRDNELFHWIMADVPVTTLCPCSKKNSNNGAHNQRALVKTKAVIEERVWLEELVEMVEAEGSSELYSVLKRDDEAFVTDEAYDNPKFVEDVVRDLSLKFSEHSNLQEYYIDCTSFESIHNHDAYARVIEGDIWQAL
jgi:GTP cyclohydrolase I